MSDAGNDADAGRQLFSRYKDREDAENQNMDVDDPETDVRRFYAFDVALGTNGICRPVVCGQNIPWKPREFPQEVYVTKRRMAVGFEVAVFIVLLSLQRTRDACVFGVLWLLASIVTARNAPFR